MFAYGVQEGYSPKKECLSIKGDLFSESIVYKDERIYAVKDGKGKTYGASTSAKKAWEETLEKLYESTCYIISVH